MSLTKEATVSSKKQPPPMSKVDKDLLIYGFIRLNFSFDRIPIDIINFIINDWFIDGISYKQALDALLNDRCCIGVYDYKIEEWRTGVYMRHWENKQRIMIRYGYYNSKTVKPEKFFVLTKFPTNAVKINDTNFKPTLGLLHDSNLSRQTVDQWQKRKEKEKRKEKREQQKRASRQLRMQQQSIFQAQRKVKSASFSWQATTNNEDEDSFLEEATYNLI